MTNGTRSSITPVGELLQIADDNLQLGNAVMEEISQALARQHAAGVSDEALQGLQEKISPLVLLAAGYTSVADVAARLAEIRLK